MDANTKLIELDVPIEEIRKLGHEEQFRRIRLLSDLTLKERQSMGVIARACELQKRYANVFLSIE